MVYLLISICISSFLFVIFKLFDVLKINTFQAIVVNYFTAAVLGFYLSNNSVSFQEIPDQPWFLGAFLLGIMFILVFNIMALTSQKNGLSVASVSSKMSVVIAIIFGVWYYEESLSLIKLMGIVTGKPKVTESLDTKQIVARVAKSTDKNDHTGAVMELSVFLNDTKSFKKLEAIETIHTIEGSMPSEISKYRDNILKDLMNKFKSKYGSDAAKELNGAF